MQHVPSCEDDSSTPGMVGWKSRDVAQAVWPRSTATASPSASLRRLHTRTAPSQEADANVLLSHATARSEISLA